MNVPSGITTWIGRIAPPLTGVAGSRNDLTIENVPVYAQAGPAFIGPRTWAAVPVKSKINSPPATVSVHSARMGSVV